MKTFQYARNIVTCLACGESFLPGEDEAFCPSCARPVSSFPGRAKLSLHPFVVHLTILMVVISFAAWGFHVVAERVSSQVTTALASGVQR